MLDPMPAQSPPRPSSSSSSGPRNCSSTAPWRIVAAKAPSDPETETRDLTPGNFTPGTFAELVSPSLFGESRVVVVRSAQDLAADDATMLTSVLDELAEEITLVVVHIGGVKGKALLTAVEKAGAARIDIAKVTKPTERIAFLREEFKAARRQITEEAARALLDAVGNELRELAAAASQLISDTADDAKGPIDETVVAKYYSGRAEVSGFTVADLAVDGRTAQALEQLRWALATGTAPVLITSALAAGVRSVARVASAPRGARPADLARDLGMPPVEDRQGAAAGARLDAGWDRYRAAGGGRGRRRGEGRRGDPAYALERCVVTVCQARGQGTRG